MTRRAMRGDEAGSTSTDARPQRMETRGGAKMATADRKADMLRRLNGRETVDLDKKVFRGGNCVFWVVWRELLTRVLCWRGQLPSSDTRLHGALVHEKTQHGRKCKEEGEGCASNWGTGEGRR